MDVVVGVDGSDDSIEALKYAWTLAAPLGGRVTAVTTWHVPKAAATAAALATDWIKEAEEISDEALATAFGEDVPDGVTGEVVEGPPAVALIERSRAADLVVVGSRGLGGFSRLLLGSVSSAVVQHAHAPVLVFHAKERKQS